MYSRTLRQAPTAQLRSEHIQIHEHTSSFNTNQQTNNITKGMTSYLEIVKQVTSRMDGDQGAREGLRGTGPRYPREGAQGYITSYIDMCIYIYMYI